MISRRGCKLYIFPAREANQVAVCFPPNPHSNKSDLLEALPILSGDGLARSTYVYLAAKIRVLMVDRDFIPHKFCRDYNY